MSKYPITDAVGGRWQSWFQLWRSSRQWREAAIWRSRAVDQIWVTINTPACVYASESSLIWMINEINKTNPHLSLLTARRRSCYTDPRSSTLPPAQGLEAFGNAWSRPHWPRCSPSEGQMSRLVQRGKWNTAGRDTDSHCCKMLPHTNIQFFFCWNHLLREKKQWITENNALRRALSLMHLLHVSRQEIIPLRVRVMRM